MKGLLRISKDVNFVLIEQDINRLGWTPILKLRKEEAEELMTKIGEVIDNNDIDWVELTD